MDSNPLVVKYIAMRNPMESNPPRWIFTMSSIVERVDSYAVFGSKDWIMISNSFWKSCKGMYGMMEKRKMIEGKIARKKLNASACERVTTEPF